MGLVMASGGEVRPGGALGEGRYRLERRLGAGGMASVWLAHDERLGRPVAIKVISDVLASDPPYVARFRREARMAAALSHPHLVEVFDFGTERQRPYMVMEYMPGGSLADVLGRSEAEVFDPESVARALLDALAAIHEAGIVHRDVKPANVLIGSDGQIKLTDFGIARPDDATSLTQTGQVVGTARYLAPEVARGQPATPQSDLYASGVLLEQFARGDAADRLGPLIAQLTATDPNQRPASARQGLELLADPAVTAPTEKLSATPERPGTAPTPGLVNGGDRRVGRRKATALGLLTAGLLAAVAIALVPGGDGGRKAARSQAQTATSHPSRPTQPSTAATASTTPPPARSAPVTPPPPATSSATSASCASVEQSQRQLDDQKRALDQQQHASKDKAAHDRLEAQKHELDQQRHALDQQKKTCH